MEKLIVTLDWPYSNIPWIWVSSLLASDVIKEKNFEVIRAVSTLSSCSGNMLYKSALERGATEVLSVSADQSFPRDVLSRMRAHNKDCVSALTATRQPGHHWMAFNLDKNGLGHKVHLHEPLQKVDVVGGGCILIKGHVLRGMPPPWSKTTFSRDGCQVLQTSDFYFFKKLKECGFELYIDTTLESYHQNEIILNAQTLGRPLPYMDIIENNTYIPVTAAEEDERDLSNGSYSPEESKIEVIYSN